MVTAAAQPRSFLSSDTGSPPFTLFIKLSPASCKLMINTISACRLGFECFYHSCSKPASAYNVSCCYYQKLLSWTLPPPNCLQAGFRVLSPSQLLLPAGLGLFSGGSVQDGSFWLSHLEAVRRTEKQKPSLLLPASHAAYRYGHNKKEVRTGHWAVDGIIIQNTFNSKVKNT